MGDYCEVPKLELTPFVQKLPLPPDADKVVRVRELYPPIDPFDNCKAENPPANDPNDGCDLYPGEPGAERPADRALQRFAEFPPVKFYEMFVRPFDHLYHPELMQKSRIWGYGNKRGKTWSPGPTFRARYGEPIVVRIHNNLPFENPGNDGFGIPQISTHLHNFHTATESDGNPIMFYDTGNYLDHHYAMYQAGGDEREALGHLWYHDHRADFTSQNVYKGLSGTFLAYDEFDSNTERARKKKRRYGRYDYRRYLNDFRRGKNKRGGRNKGGRFVRTAYGDYDNSYDYYDDYDDYGRNGKGKGKGKGKRKRDRKPEPFRLPSKKFDVPLGFGDKQFDPMTHKLVFDPFNLDGFLGEHVTVNGAVAPYMNVQRRKYRFRMVNFGPSRIYTFRVCKAERRGAECKNDRSATELILIGNDGNLLNKAIPVDNVTISAAERYDVVIDFSKFRRGTRINLMNVADQTSGKGRTGVFAPMDSEFAQKVMQFRVRGGKVRDPSRIPVVMREKPEIYEDEIVCEREFVFDNIEGSWTINDELFDFLPRLQVQQGTAERWTIKNASRDWEHPIHIHLEEHQFEIRDGATPPDFEQMRKDVALLRPGDEITLKMRHRDWLTEYPMHCHNTVHEDHAMMLLWEVVEGETECVARP